MKTIISIIVLLMTSISFAIESGKCYSLSSPLIENSYAFTEFCTLEIENPITKKMNLAFGLFITGKDENDNTVTDIFTCGAADYVKIVRAGDIDQVFVNPEANILEFQGDEFRLLTEVRGTYKESSAADNEKYQQMLRGRFSEDAHRSCEFKGSLGDIPATKVAVQKKTLQFDFSRSDIDPKTLTASYAVTCSYDVGFWPFEGSSLCGETQMALKFNDKGQLELPEIAAYPAEGGDYLDHYKVSLRIDRGDQAIVWISANDGQSVKNFDEFQKTILITKLLGGEIPIDYQNQPLLSTKLKDYVDASLHISLEVTFGHVFAEGFQMTDNFGWFGLGGNNHSYTAEKNQLKNMKKFVAPDTYLATTQPAENYELRFYAAYDSGYGMNAEVRVYNQIYMPLKIDSVTALPRLNLDKKPN